MQESPFPTGHVLAEKYRVDGMLGSGGHGVVLLAHHLALNERVAIKILRPEVATDQDAVTRFLREARASVRIKGEHVTRVLDVGSLETGIPYMVMEHLSGEDLSSYINSKGALPITQAIDFIIQTCEALAEAHALGIVHRDIKPANLFWITRPDGSPCIKVLDFGISKAMPNLEAGEASLTQTQTILGSPQYMAPEQMRSSKRVDGRTDIWSIGTTLHELITGHPPFEAETMPELFAMILQDPPPPLAEKRPEASPELQHVVNRCMEKEADRRYADVQELALALMPLASPAGVASAERVNRVGGKPRPIPVPEIRRNVDTGAATPVAARTGPNTGPPPPLPLDRPVRWAFIAAGGVIAIALTIGWNVAQNRKPADAAPPTGMVSPPPTVVPTTEPPPLVPPDSPPIESAKIDTPGPSLHVGSGTPPGHHPVPSASSAQAAPPPPPPAPAPEVKPAPPASTSRPPGVASSRYD